jgi:hypothetical protein
MPRIDSTLSMRLAGEPVLSICAIHVALRFLMIVACRKRNSRNSAFRSERLPIASESCCYSTSLASLNSTIVIAAGKQSSRRMIWALITRNLGSTYRLNASGI